MEKSNIFESAYYNQSVSLAKVQEIGPALEKEIKEKLSWDSGRLIYYKNEDKKISYDIQVDACYPTIKSPEVFVSVTYCDPDTPGHSNENKLQLKLGELMLFKAKYPKLKGVLIIGGTREAWLSYVIEAFEYFFDKVLFTWDVEFDSKIEQLKSNPQDITCKHSDIWDRLSAEWQMTPLSFADPVDSFLREKAWNYMREHGCEGDTPDKIKNEIIRNC